MRNRDIERQIRDAGEHAGERVRQYADGAAGTAQSLFDRGRSLGERFGRRVRFEPGTLPHDSGVLRASCRCARCHAADSLGEKQ